MKKNITQSLLFMALVLMLNAGETLAQGAVLPQMAVSKSFLVQSSVNKKSYVINVILPKSYSETDGIKYPVLYVLDGRYSTTSFYSINETFTLGGAKEIKEVIYVSIDANVASEADWLTSRYTDLTPSSSPVSDTAIANFFKLPVSPSGGAQAFLATIEKDVIPLIEQKYKTAERGIFGHSLGGLFAAYCLLTKPELFQKYAMNSPSIWWNNVEMVALADSMAKHHPNIKASIFISTGSLEGDFMNVPVNQLIRHLKDKFSHLTITTKIFEEETHLSVVPAASSRSLRVLFSQ